MTRPPTLAHDLEALIGYHEADNLPISTADLRGLLSRHQRLDDPDSTQPTAAHHDGPDTEHEAAALALPNVGTLRHRVLDLLFLHEQGLTDREISERSRVYLYSIAPRRAELVRMGWVRDSGRRRPGDPGKPSAVVWILTDAGAKAFAE